MSGRDNFQDEPYYDDGNQSYGDTYDGGDDQMHGDGQVYGDNYGQAYEDGQTYDGDDYTQGEGDTFVDEGQTYADEYTEGQTETFYGDEGQTYADEYDYPEGQTYADEYTDGRTYADEYTEGQTYTDGDDYTGQHYDDGTEYTDGRTFTTGTDDRTEYTDGQKTSVSGETYGSNISDPMKGPSDQALRREEIEYDRRQIRRKIKDKLLERSEIDPDHMNEEMEDLLDSMGNDDTDEYNEDTEFFPWKQREAAVAAAAVGGKTEGRIEGYDSMERAMTAHKHKLHYGRGRGYGWSAHSGGTFKSSASLDEASKRQLLTDWESFRQLSSSKGDLSKSSSKKSLLSGGSSRSLFDVQTQQEEIRDIVLDEMHERRMKRNQRLLSSLYILVALGAFVAFAYVVEKLKIDSYETYLPRGTSINKQTGQTTVERGGENDFGPGLLPGTADRTAGVEETPNELVLPSGSNNNHNSQDIFGLQQPDGEQLVVDERNMNHNQNNDDNESGNNNSHNSDTEEDGTITDPETYDGYQAQYNGEIDPNSYDGYYAGGTNSRHGRNIRGNAKKFRRRLTLSSNGNEWAQADEDDWRQMELTLIDDPVLSSVDEKAHRRLSEVANVDEMKDQRRRLGNTERLMAIFQILKKFTSGSDFRNKNSPQHKAYVWIAELDNPLRPIPTNAKETAKFLQRYALAVLYFATNGSKWFLDQSKEENQWWASRYDFLSGKDECEWHEISETGFLYGAGECDEDGMIQMLMLYSNKLQGILPREIGCLTSLHTLALQNNWGLEGAIPQDSLEMLKKLKTLYLHSTKLRGDVSYMCDATERTGLVNFRSDCFGVNARIQCSCCRTCCGVQGNTAYSCYLVE